MSKTIRSFFFLIASFIATFSFAQSDSIVLKDAKWENDFHAGSTELFIPSGNSLLAGLIYRANGKEKHPTLLLLHGYPGNERNLDLAQVLRAQGWNVIYFDYRGSWGSQGKFSFKNCVEDVVNVVVFCSKYQDSLKIDTARLALFGHSMGGWVCLKAMEQLPQIKKGFALSTWNIYGDFKNVQSEKQLLEIVNNPNAGVKYFVLNATPGEIFVPVLKEPAFFNLTNTPSKLADRKIIMLDEHEGNKELADAFRQANRNIFEYQVWTTDHGFNNKRISLINKVVEFLNK